MFRAKRGVLSIVMLPPAASTIRLVFLSPPASFTSLSGCLPSFVILAVIISPSVFISRKIQDIQLEKIQNGTFKDEIIDAEIRSLFMKLSDIRNNIEPHNNISKYYNQFVALRNEIYNAPQKNFSIDSSGRGQSRKKGISRQSFDTVLYSFALCHNLR